jgi:hypothetical protein
MKQINDGIAARVRRSMFKKKEAESYGELIWLMDPDAPAAPRRAWRQELDRVSVTNIKSFVEPARHTF